MLIHKFDYFIEGILKTKLDKILKRFKRIISSYETRCPHPVLNLILLVLIFVVQSSILNAQLIDNKFGQAFSDQPFFNSTVIKKLRLKSISGNFLHYKLGDRLRKTDYFRKYIFNVEGQLVEQQEFTLLDYIGDTSINKYKYDIKGNLIESLHSDRYGFYGYFYEYDNENRVVYSEYRRRYGKEGTENNDILGVESIVYSEKSTYQNYPNQQQETIYNTSNIPYKDIFTYYNDDSLVIGKMERLRRTLETKNTTYTYNENHLIDTIDITSNSEGVQERKYVFVYNGKGYLLKKKEFKNDELTTQYEVIYRNNTSFINDFLIQDVATNFIRDLILSEYTFFDH